MLKIQIKTETDICVVYLFGDLVFSEVLTFETTMKRLFSSLTGPDNDDPPPVIINFEHVTLIDSSGVAALVGLHLESKHRLLVLGFVHFHRRVLDVIERTHVDVLLSIFASEAEGRQHLTDLERTHERFHCAIEGQLTLKDHRIYLLKCFNISQGGIGAFSPQLIPMEEDIMQFHFIEIPFSALVYISRVMISPGGYEVGLEFHKKDEAFVKRIKQAIQQITTPSAEGSEGSILLNK